MDATAFVSLIESAGFTLTVQGEKLIVIPASQLTELQRQFIRKHKAELLVILAGRTLDTTRHPELNPELQDHHGGGLVRCCDCRHQEPTNHPALIQCGMGRQAPGGSGLWWKTDRHQCGEFEKEGSALK